MLLAHHMITKLANADKLKLLYFSIVETSSY